jgi:iron complex transport system substrate-binding protein
MKKTITFILAIVMILAVAGCTEKVDSTNSESITVTDMAGRTVTIEGPIEKIVAHQPETMELVFSVVGEEAVDKIVAVGKNKSSEIVMGLYAQKYPQLDALPEIGGGKANYDAEAIIALDADIFIINSTSPDSMAETFDTLEKAGIATIVVDMSSDTMNGPKDAITLIGEVFKKQDKAKEIVDFIDAQFALVLDKKLNERENKPTVYVEKGSGTSDEYDVTFTSGGMASVVEMTGGDNIATGVISSNSQIDPEYLIDSNPDFIFIGGSFGYGADIDEANALIKDYMQRTGWSTMNAVEAGNIYEVALTMYRNQLCFYPTLMMAKLFYPEEFGDVEPDEILQEYFDKYMYLDYDLGIWFNSAGK